jgi:MraZ protein
MLFAGAVDEVPDRQGRVTLSAALREYAGLDRDVTVVGNNNRLEIWESEAWDTYEAEQNEQFAQLSEEVLPGIF